MVIAVIVADVASAVIEASAVEIAVEIAVVVAQAGQVVDAAKDGGVWVVGTPGKTAMLRRFPGALSLAVGGADSARGRYPFAR